MKVILEKLSSYNIFNYLFPGLLFVCLTEKLTSFSFIQKNWIFGMFLYYFIGLIISRIGSLVAEPFLEKIKFVRYAGYKDYVEASKSDSKIEILTEQNNMFRTLCSMSMMLIFLKSYDELKEILSWGSDVNGFIFLVGLFLLFLFSYRKQTGYVVQRVESALKKEKE